MEKRSDILLFRQCDYLCKRRLFKWSDKLWFCDLTVGVLDHHAVQIIHQLLHRASVLHALPPLRTAVEPIKVASVIKEWLLSLRCLSESFPDFILLWTYPDHSNFSHHWKAIFLQTTNHRVGLIACSANLLWLQGVIIEGAALGLWHPPPPVHFKRKKLSQRGKAFARWTHLWRRGTFFFSSKNPIPPPETVI